MLRNYIVTALRNLGRNRLYAAISILGLAVAFAAAILIGQYVRNEFSYDHWLPGYQQIYKLADEQKGPGAPPLNSDGTEAPLADQIKAALPGSMPTRLTEDFMPLRRRPGDPSAVEPAFAWADPNFFTVFPLPALGGDLSKALAQPDSVVITRRIARKYFGKDLPLGETLQVQRATRFQAGGFPAAEPPWHTLRVTAVLKDLPSNTNLSTEIFASGRSAYSTFAMINEQPSTLYIRPFVYTFVRLSPKQTKADLQRILPLVVKPELEARDRLIPGTTYAYHAVPLSEAHLTPPGVTFDTIKPVGSRTVSYAFAGVGALIVLVAAINFVTLMTARASRRALEVGIRKASGARRVDLMTQFIGEALIQVGVSALIAAALAETLTKPIGAFAQRELVVDFIHDPMLLLGVVLAALIIGLLAAIYPAVVLSSFRPASVLKGNLVQTSGSPIARQVLVVIQFAILVALILTTATLYRQTRYALDRDIGTVDARLMVSVPSRCNNAFPDEVRKLPGVAGTACASMDALNTASGNTSDVRLVGGGHASFVSAPVDFGFFELYGLRPLAGRLFSRDHGEDGIVADPNTRGMPTVIINETAARGLGFSDPHQAVGKPMIWTRNVPDTVDPTTPSIPLTAASTIIGVVPDMPANVRVATVPTFYWVAPKRLFVLSIKLIGKDVPDTIDAISATWRKTGASQPIKERFLWQSRLNRYRDLIVQSVTIGACAILAVVISCLGLFALSAYTTERRTKEIGVRKAMGADTGQVVLMLLWQFTIPVLTAIAITIPAGVLAMNWWLQGFIYRVSLSAWTFVLASVAAVGIAWLTVTYQSFIVARAKPVAALRYE